MDAATEREATRENRHEDSPLALADGGAVNCENDTHSNADTFVSTNKATGTPAKIPQVTDDATATVAESTLKPPTTILKATSSYTCMTPLAESGKDSPQIIKRANDMTPSATSSINNSTQASQHHRRGLSGGEISNLSLGGISRHKRRSRIGEAYAVSNSGRHISLRQPSSSGHPHRDAERAPSIVLPEDGEETTWGTVCRACCVHSGLEWIHISGYLLALFLVLYFFLVGLDLLGTAFKVVGGCTAGSLLGSDTSPLAAVMIGIIATTLLQSSSTTTAVIVSLVSGGLDVQQGIYMIMGANVGTCATAMLVSLAHMGDGEELERAFSGGSVLFVFNFMTIILLLPIEIATKYLYKFTKVMLPSSVGEGEKWEGPIKKIVSPLVKRIIIANTDLVDQISTNEIMSCSQQYPVECSGGIESYDTCRMGVVGCDKDTGKCPLFFQDGSSKNDDMISGWVCLVIALTLLVICLIGLVALLRKMLLGASTAILYKATNINQYIAILIGIGVTILVQSSSITSSTLVPLAGVGILKLENIYPLVLGSDIGTTVTALMAALVSSKVEALQIALVHLFFNVTGGLIWYPVPFMRNIILGLARLVGKATKHWRAFPIFFIMSMFFVFPLLLLGISSCFEKQTIGFTALGSFILVIIFCAILYFLVWWYFWDGKSKFLLRVQRRQNRAAAFQALADEDLDYMKVDIIWCKNEIGRIKDFAGQLQVSSTTRMEEGRPFVTIALREEEAETTVATVDDDRLSTFESCRSRPWKDILYIGAGSIRSELFQGSDNNPTT